MEHAAKPCCIVGMVGRTRLAWKSYATFKVLLNHMDRITTNVPARGSALFLCNSDGFGASMFGSCGASKE
jgi:hypothetical protein